MNIMRFEARHEPLISRRQFARRMLRHGGYATILIAGSILLGMIGYTTFDHLSPIDALLNTTMLLGGMGPVSPIEGTSAKLFASAFSLYSGLVFLIVAGVMLAPVFHRVLHHFHWKGENGG